MQFGKANYNKKTNDTAITYYQLKTSKDSNEVSRLVLRIAPPINEQAEKGIWALYIKTHFGYSINTAKRDGSGTYKKMEPFLCPKVERNGQVEVDCPECNNIEQQEESLKTKIAQLKTEGKTDSEINAMPSIKHLKEWGKDHNLDRKWHMYAKDLTGKWGIFKISHTLKKRLDALLKELASKGMDPLSPENGLWFEFTRSGVKFNEIDDQVKPYVELQPDRITQKLKTDTFTADDAAQLEELPRLTALGRKLDYGQIKLLAESRGEELVVKSIFQSGTRTKSESSPAPSYTKPAESFESSPEASPTPVGSDPEVEALEKALAAAIAKKNAAASPPSAPTPPPAVKKPEMPDMDSFLAMFENK